MCMWPLTKPGVTNRWRASITRSARTPASEAALPTRFTLPSSTRIQPSWMIRRSRSTGTTERALSVLRLWRGVARPGRSRSAALELRAALFGERLDALLIVLAVEAIGDELVEHHQVAVAVGLHELLDRCLRGPKSQRRVAGHRQGVVAREAL